MAEETSPGDSYASVFEPDAETRQRMQTAYRRGVRSVRNVLFIVAGLIALSELLINLKLWSRSFTVEAAIVIAIDLCIVGAFIGLGCWALKKPFTALVIAIAIDISLQLSHWIITGSFRGASLLTFLLFLSVLRKAKALQKYPYRDRM